MQHDAMARVARIAVPGIPHHVTQRGNRRQPIFVEPEDYALYRDLLAERYLAFNPVRARLVAAPEDWPHGSVRANLAERDDALVSVAPALERVGRFADFWS
jgi:hypothetical protein